MLAKFRNVGAMVLCGLVLGTTGTTTEALGGGGGSGLSSVTVALSQPGAGNVGPRGSAVLTFNAAQTIGSVNVQLSNVHLPSGTMLNVVFTDNAIILPSGAWANQVAGTMVVSNGTASLSISTANGNFVPLFGTNGEITVNVLPGPGVSAGLYMNGVYAFGGGGGGGGGH
jgi:hypothetical protein